MTIFNMLKGSTALRSPDDGGGTGGGGGGQGGGGNAPWFQGNPGIDQEMVGHITNKGWDKLPVNEVVAHSLKAWKEAERMVGVPANQLLRLPAEENAPEWGAVYERLGRPKEAAGYDFSAIKFTDGTDLDPGFTDLVRDVAFRNGLSTKAATDLAASFTKFLEGAETSDAAEKQAALALEKQTLDKNWGANKAGNEFIAQQAAKALGVDADAIKALESVIGYAKVMEMFLNVGQKIGEDKFISGGKGNDGNPGVLSRDQAVARRADLMKDRAWVDRYQKGDTAAMREMTALNHIIAGE